MQNMNVWISDPPQIIDFPAPLTTDIIDHGAIARIISDLLPKKTRLFIRLTDLKFPYYTSPFLQVKTRWNASKHSIERDSSIFYHTSETITEKTGYNS
jgi:hypothetical protein